MKKFWRAQTAVVYRWDSVGDDDEEREEIHKWSKNRQLKLRGINKTYHGFLVHTFSLDTLRSFFQNFNFMVIIQMILAGLSIYIFQRSNVYFDMNVMLYISPIVFPLAFSINTDFQRREKVLDDLASFKTNCMLWFFCVREWKEAAELDDKWTNERYAKLKSILFHLREFLLTKRGERRKVILKAMYEDLSDCGEVIEEVRAKKLPSSIGIGANLVTCLQAMTLSFERLRNVREYRSPRSIRSFNKVLILLLPIIIAPYFVNQSRDRDGNIVRAWTPYYISILVSFVFSALQGVQDKLDDPFDGMSEDDINLEQIDEWTFSSLQATVNRSFKVGRFHVNNVDCEDPLLKLRPSSALGLHNSAETKNSIAELRKASCTNFVSRQVSTTSLNDYVAHPFADVLERIAGDTRIEKGGVVRPAGVAEAIELQCLDLSKRISKSNGSPLNDTNVLPPIEKQKRFALERFFKNHIGNKTGTMELKQRSVSFNENPLFLTKQTSPSENSLEVLDTPVLLKPQSPRTLKPQLKQTQSSSLYTSRTLSASPHSPNKKLFSELPSSFATEFFHDARIPNAYETIVDLPETLDGNEDINGTAEECLLLLQEDQDFVVIDKPLQGKNLSDKEYSYESDGVA